ncbi:MAG TPA: VOC family protein [Acidimicrobiales bacterium]|nr:VOC family protein [Acidimicrobiales bacterium]
MPEIMSIHHIAITVSDLEVSEPWYERVFAMSKVMEGSHPDGVGRFVLFSNADFSTMISLHVHPENDGGRFNEARNGLDHVSFRVADHHELEAWESRLSELGVEHSPVNDQEMYSVVVFRDPDNIQLEFISVG